MAPVCLCSWMLVLTAVCQISSPAVAFRPSPAGRVVARQANNRQFSGKVWRLEAKKSKRRESKGFGKTEIDPMVESTAPPISTPLTTSETMSGRSAPTTTTTTTTTSSSLLQSVSGGSTGIPQEEELSAEERAARILREQYGMKTMEEQQLSAKQLETVQKRKKKLQEWKKAAESNEDFDVMSALPAPVLKGIDAFLKAGVVVTGTLFILAGLGITIEAWSKTSGQPLDSNLDKFIVETIEPNFTPGLLVLLGFSVSLGLFGAAQLGSAGAQYKEDK